MKKDLRVIKTEESIRKALLNLIKTKSLDSITVAELCRLAKINRGTFYIHYKGVHDVFKEYVALIVDDLKKSYEAPYHSTNDQIEDLEAGMIKIFHHVKRYQSFYDMVFDERMPMMYFYMVFDAIKSFMKKSRDKSSINSKENLYQDYLISYQTNAILGMLIEWHRQKYVTPVQELNQQLMDILSRDRLFR